MNISILLPILIGLTVFVTSVILYEQKDYILTTERANVTTYNKQYVIATVKFFKFNRTYTALNFTLDVKRPIDRLRMDVQAYKFQSNEYRLFPMQFSRDACETRRKNEFGLQNLYKHGNFTGCPYRKQIYHVYNWGPDYVKFPPYIPHGQYNKL